MSQTKTHTSSVLSLIILATTAFGNISEAHTISSKIQMLPPLTQADGECKDTNTLKIIAWDGSTTMRCRTDVFIDPMTGLFLAEGGFSINQKTKLNKDGSAFIFGNVGVGTDKPTVPLDVHGSAHFSDTLTVQNKAMIAGIASIEGEIADGGTVRTGNDLEDLIKSCAPQGGGYVKITDKGTLSCEKSTPVATPSALPSPAAVNCAPVASKTWEENGATCSGPLPGLNNTQTADVTDIAKNGVAKFVCSNGGIAEVTKSCTKPAAASCSGPIYPATGTICPDGTVYAGKVHNTSTHLFMTRCDIGMTWNGSACIGTRATITWGPDGYLGADDNLYGYKNTKTIASKTGSYAAKRCDSLIANGHDDWYLPAIDELYEMARHRSTQNFVFKGNYWSSSEIRDSDPKFRNSQAYFYNFEFLKSSSRNKLRTESLYARCARK